MSLTTPPPPERPAAPDPSESPAGALPPQPPRAPRRSGPSRREFAAALTLTALGACVSNRRGTVAPASAPTPAAALPPAPPTTAAAAPSAPPPDAVTESLVAAVEARYGADVVPPANRAAFRAAVARSVQLSRRLARTPVANAIDPFSSLLPVPPTAAAASRRRPS